MASLVDPDTLNPLLSTSQISIDLSMFWAGYLFNFDDRNQLVPELATTVPTLANGGIGRGTADDTYHLGTGVQVAGRRAVLAPTTWCSRGKRS